MLASHSVGMAQVNVRAELVSGSPVTGRFISMTETAIELQDGSSDRLTLDPENVIAVTATDFDRSETLPISKSPWLLLSTGDRLRMKPLLIDDEQIVAEWSSFSSLPAVSLPLELCEGTLISMPVASREQARVVEQLINHHNKVDLITLTNGDGIDGEFISLENEQFTLETSIGKVQARIEQTQSLFFNKDLISEPMLPESYTVLTLADGSVLHARKVSFDGDLVIAESIGRFRISVPATAVREFRFYDSNRVDLTSVEPVETTITPYLSTRREPKRNRNVIGGFLSLRGRLSLAGTGVISGTSQTWELNQRFSQFRATVGVDDAAGGAGSVVFEVHVDDAVAWQSDLISGTTPAVTVPAVDLTGAVQLRLVVRFADRGNVSDYADWCEPTLIRKPDITDAR